LRIVQGGELSPKSVVIVEDQLGDVGHCTVLLVVGSLPCVYASAEGFDQLLACLLATAARFGADPAVLMPGGVAGALVAARAADDDAGLQDGTGHIGVIAGVPGQHARRGVAHVSAVFV
jgi:hypothetical protein